MRASLISSMRRFHEDETGQGLVEYTLILALIALAATAGMNSLAAAVNTAFSAVGSRLGIYVS